MAQARGGERGRNRLITDHDAGANPAPATYDADRVILKVGDTVIGTAKASGIRMVLPKKQRTLVVTHFQHVKPQARGKRRDK